MGTTVNSLLFARTLFSLIFANFSSREFNILAKCFRIYSRTQHVVSVEFSSLFHHSIYLWFICFPRWSIDELENLHADRTTLCFEPWQKPKARLGSRKTGLIPPPQYFNTDHSKAVILLWFLTVTCSCYPYLYFGSAIMLVTYFSKFYVAEWPSVWKRAVHSVYRECLS